MLITVFTPLYNRENSIAAVYNSLLMQTCKDFEWLVINDGSTDSSATIMEDIISKHDNSFPIRYQCRENHGLMYTLNEGVRMAEGTLFMRLDSDDQALPNAIELITDNYHYVKDKDDICALVFRSVDYNKKSVGYHPFDEVQICDFALYRDKYKAKGDRSEVMKTEIFKKYPFPIIDGEKFCPEGLIWNRIASDYKAIYMISPIYQKGAPDDSITADVYNYLKRNSKGTTLYYREIVSNKKFCFKYRLLNAIKFYRYVFFSGESLFTRIPLTYVVLGMPLGILVVLFDFIKNSKKI